MKHTNSQREEARARVAAAIARKILEADNPPLTFLRLFAKAEVAEARRLLARRSEDPLSGRRCLAEGGEPQ